MLSKNKHRLLIRAALLLLCLLLCAPPLTACRQEDPLAIAGISSLTLDKHGKVTALVTLDAKSLAAHKGEKISLYELMPGESASAATAREPLDSGKAAGEVKLRFPLDDNGRSRLYSSFVVAFEDGSLLSPNGTLIQNPELLATDTRTFPWAGTQKGLQTDKTEDALSLHAMHVMQEIGYSMLESNPERVVNRIRSAAESGAQVSLRIRLDAVPDLSSAATVLDTLAAATCLDGKTSALTAIFLDASPLLDERETAALAARAHLALRSHTAGARVYIVSSHPTVTDTMAYFSNIQSAVVSLGAFPWGAAVSPALSLEAPWDTTDADRMTMQSITRITDFLSRQPSAGKPSFTAVLDLRYGAEDPERQSASLAYAYLAAVKARVGLVFYGSHFDDAYGLLSEVGELRPAESIFRSINGTLSEEQLALCQAVMGDEQITLPAPAATLATVGGIANLGDGGLEQAALYDFSDGDAHGFTGIRAATDPSTHLSAAWNVPVLYTWLTTDGNSQTDTGIRRRLEAAELSGVTALSTRVLIQLPDAQSCTLRLRLDGTAKNGSHLTYTSEIRLDCRSWQTVTFQIASFVADVDPNASCTLALTVLSNGETERSDFVFWVKDLSVRRPQTTDFDLMPYLLILLCIISVLSIVAVIYLITVRRRRRRR